MNITEFLEARLLEDAVSATLRECHRQGCESIPDESGYSYPCDCGLPERMIAECAAKQAIIVARKSIDRSSGMDDWYAGRSDANYDALRALAAVYKDHPDYQQGWAA